MKKPNLTTKANSKQSDHALAASNIRKELKAKWPGVTFSVQSKSHAGGTSVYVGWVDGPKQKDVDVIVEKYEYGSFDGMLDSYEYKKDFDGAYGSAKYVIVQRSYTKEVAIEAAEQLNISYTTYESRGKECVEIPDFDDNRRVMSVLRDTDFTLESQEEVVASATDLTKERS